jgi:deazaflavin-dependent oxidoreductase (nitroreductase family)
LTPSSLAIRLARAVKSGARRVYGVFVPPYPIRFNKTVNNRVQGIYAWILPPYAVILHRGRRTGRAYRTPLLAFRRGRVLIIALLYGERSDWLRNLRAGGGRIVRGGRTYEVRGGPNVKDTDAVAELADLPRPARAYCRLADRQVLVEIGERLPGFGPGRAGVRRT